MNLVEAVRRYFHGESKQVTVSNFEKAYSEMENARAEVSELVKGMTNITGNVDTIKKAASEIMSSNNLTSDDVTIALDNIKFSDQRMADYVSEFTENIKKANDRLDRAESKMTKLIMNNHNLATIIADVKHDDRIEESLRKAFDAYGRKEVNKDAVISAYNNAKEIMRTDRSLESILDTLKDGNNA